MTSQNYMAAFITGHSVRGCTGLSSTQVAFQQRSMIPEERWLKCNFPYIPTTPFPDSVPLLTASLNNAAHYMFSRGQRFRKQNQQAVVSAFADVDCIILLAGSCGLELLNNLALPAELRRKMHVFACGPVSRAMPEVASFYSAQGIHDWISRAFHRQANLRFPCSHMNYLNSPITLSAFNSFVERSIQAHHET